jgi:tetratricopeptide (TPR) repeat protein
MNIFKKFFSKKKPAAKSSGQPEDNSPNQVVSKTEEGNELDAKSDLITVYDKLGREMKITREQWRDSVLVGHLEKNWDDPNGLYSAVLTALQDGFVSDVLDAAKRLYEIDVDKERGGCMYAIVLMKNGMLAEAEAALKQALTDIGDSGVLMTNLAKVYYEQSKPELSEQTLYEGLVFDPNQDNGLDWYLAIQKEKNGQTAYVETLKTIAGFPNAWRALVWLGREHLANNKKDLAIAGYQKALEMQPVPNSYLLQQISGDLGKNGFIEDIVVLVLPKFEPSVHGYHVGNNLIKALIELKRAPEAKSILEVLYAQNRPDWKEGLDYWDNQLDNELKHFGPVDEEAISEVINMAIPRPAWLVGLKLDESIYQKKSETPFTVVTLSASCERAEEFDKPRVTKTDAEGALCRGFPLTICDSLNIKTDAKALMVVPYVKNGGLVFFAKEHSDEHATSIMKAADGDLVILPHLIAKGDVWTMQLRVFEKQDTKLVATMTASFSPDNPAAELQDLVLKVHDFIHRNYDLTEQASSAGLDRIPAKVYAHYVDANSSCLAILNASESEGGMDTLYGVRHIYDKFMRLASDFPENGVFMLMLIWALLKDKEAGSVVYQEYFEKLDYLMDRVKINGDLQSVFLRKIESLKVN